MPKTPLAERFWPNVDRREPEACWPWLAGTDAHGYGAISDDDGKIQKAHRVAWTLAKGPIPEGLEILHHCDNPPCCNYEKCLFLGTQAENVRDMFSKGRGRPGGRSVGRIAC